MYTVSMHRKTTNQDYSAPYNTYSIACEVAKEFAECGYEGRVTDEYGRTLAITHKGELIDTLAEE